MTLPGAEVAGPGQLLIRLRAAAFQLVERLSGHPGYPLEVWRSWLPGRSRTSAARTARSAQDRPRGPDLAREHGDLVTQDEGLGVLGTVGPGEQGKPAGRLIDPPWKYCQVSRHFAGAIYTQAESGMTGFRQAAVRR